MTLNRKKIGPELQVSFLYNGTVVNRFVGTDDDREYAGLTPEEFTIKICKEILTSLQPPQPALPSLVTSE